MAKAPKLGNPALSEQNNHKFILTESTALEQEFSQLERSFQAIANFPRFKQAFFLVKLAPFYQIPRGEFRKLFNIYVCQNLIDGFGGER